MYDLWFPFWTTVSNCSSKVAQRAANVSRYLTMVNILLCPIDARFLIRDREQVVRTLVE